MFSFRKNNSFDFSDERIEALSKAILELKESLFEIGVSVGHIELNNVLDAALKKDSDLLKKRVLTNEFFGGAGSLRDIYCEDSKLRIKYMIRFKKFCLELKKIGIQNRRFNQVLKTL